MPLFEKLEIAECQSLSFCNWNGVCARHMKSNDIFCHCYSNFTGTYCTSSNDSPIVQPADPTTDIYTWFWSFGFGILFFGSIIFCSYMCTRTKGDLSDFELDDYHNGRDELDGDFKLLSQNGTNEDAAALPSKVRITIDLCD